MATPLHGFQTRENRPSLHHIDCPDSVPWLVEAFKEVANHCARVLRVATKEAYHTDGAWLSVLSPTAMLRVVEAPPKGTHQYTFNIIRRWLKHAKLSGEYCDGAAMEAEISRLRLPSCVFVITCLNKMASGVPTKQTADELKHRLHELGLSTTPDEADLEALKNRLIDAMSIAPPANAVFAKLCEFFVDSAVDHDSTIATETKSATCRARGLPALAFCRRGLRFAHAQEGEAQRN